MSSIKGKAIFKKPEPLTPFQSRDRKKYCEYHESTGHDTHECRHLKDEIEALIKEGYLTEWVKERCKEVYRGPEGWSGRPGKGKTYGE